jgi:hypothetical protein
MIRSDVRPFFSFARRDIYRGYRYENRLNISSNKNTMDKFFAIFLATPSAVMKIVLPQFASCRSFRQGRRSVSFSSIVSVFLISAEN